MSELKDKFITECLGVLDRKDVKEHFKALMKPIIDVLQKKYSSEIFINMNLFESISLSNVDMFVTQSNVPYPVIVPSFPSFTNDSYLDYGSEIK